MFIPVVSVAALALAVMIAFGIVRWRQPLGKIVAVVGGLLFVSLAAFTAFVLFLAESARNGSPL